MRPPITAEGEDAGIISSLTGRAVTRDMTLRQVLARVCTADGVEGLAVCAPAQGAEGADYDVLVLGTKCPPGLSLIFTYIQGRMADVLFLDTGIYDEVLEGSRRLFSFSVAGIFFKKLERADIIYDPGGRLARGRRTARADQFITSSSSTLYGTWFGQNFGLAHVARILQSSDADYMVAWDLMIGASVSKTVQAYFEMRHAPYTGEKDAIRYLTESDPEYLGLIRAFLAASDRHWKLDLYRRLVCRAVEPFGPVWDSDVAAAMFCAPVRNPGQVSGALEYWEDLFTSRDER